MDLKINFPLQFLKVNLPSHPNLEINATERLVINLDKLNEEIIKFAAEYFYFSTLKNEAYVIYAETELTVKNLHSQIKSKLRLNKDLKTESALDEQVRLNEEYMKALKTLIETEHVKNQLTSFVAALDVKNKMLNNLVYNLKTETDAQGRL